MRLAAGLLLACISSAALAHGPRHRTLSFEDRVKAQAAIERVYYSHQIGMTRAFEDAMPMTVLESKVRKYLEQTAALNLYWKTAVTDEMLQRELERMARATRMPERLSELYAALGDDPFIIKECLVRATLVDRLARNFYAFDSAIHAEALRRAEQIQRLLVSGAMNPAANHPYRSVSELVVGDPGFRKRRAELPTRVGEVSEIAESRDAFALSVILSETTTEVRLASYIVPKTTWDAWWERVRQDFRGGSVVPVATPQGLPAAHVASCAADDTWDLGAQDGLPEPRSGQTAVWTGSFMLVWGGIDVDNGVLATGGRYDPAIDSWTSMSTLDAPSARSGHTAVWTGREMIVWGGRDADGEYLGSGGRYDPARDNWKGTPTDTAASARSEHMAVWTGTLMVVWGGQVADGADCVDTGSRFDPETDAWTATSTTDAPFPSCTSAAVWTGSVMVVWGGFNGDGTNTGGRYDPATDRWKPVSTIGVPEEHGKFTAVWTGSLMVVWGGLDFVIGARYDPATDIWKPMSTVDASGRRPGHTAVWTGSRMVAWGGSDDRGRGLNTGGSYDPDADEWTRTSDVSAPSARSGHTAVWTGSLMLVWGGYGKYDTHGGPGVGFNTGARYDPATDSWTPTSTSGAPAGHISHTAVWTGNRMVVWGGLPTDRFPRVVNTGAQYDPATASWIPVSTTNAPSARGRHTAVWTGNDMVVWGGSSADDITLDTGGRYDPATDTWTPTSTTEAPSARAGHTAVWTGNRMIVWGGYSYPDLFDTGGRYDPVTDSWTPTSTSDAPSGREAHTAVWTGSAMIVWGGYSEFGSVSTGGRYDPATDNWTPTSTTDSPDPRSEHTAVWTGKLMVVWGSGSDTGGRYDPVADGWAPTSTIGAPSERSHHCAVWTGRLVVVWGGNSGYSGDRLNSGGRYDPEADNWTPTSTTGAASPRAGHTAVWTGDRMLVWGGDSLVDVDGIGRYVEALPLDRDGDGYTQCDGDCDDAAANVHPGAAETCNGSDDDCNGVIDDGGGALCDDGNACTVGDACSDGACVSGASVACLPLDQCHAAGTCDPGTGACSSAFMPNGTACDDRSLCTTGETCQSGACTPAFSGLNHPRPRSSAYYKSLCARRARHRPPYLGDQLTAADAVCVADLSATFAEISTVDDICGVLDRRGRTVRAECEQGKQELIAAALNVCRARVCGEQSFVSRCRGNTPSNISQCFSDADGILDDPTRVRTMCQSATCELREINDGRAFRPGH